MLNVFNKKNFNLTIKYELLFVKKKIIKYDDE